MNDGFQNENSLIDYISNLKYNRYNDNIKNFVNFIFKDKINQSLPFYAEKIQEHAKPDLYIVHNGVRKNISVKKGSGNSVHQENISSFFPYMIELIGEDLTDVLKLFHFGDDTLDDSGITRYNATQSKKRYANKISLLNLELNKWNNLINFFNRFLFVGNASNIKVDAIYYGTISEGLWATIDELLEYFRDNTFYSNNIHFGPLTYQVWGRNEKRSAKHANRRYVMQIKWSSIKNDLNIIRNGE